MVDGANHGNGFANTGLLDDDARTPFPVRAKVTFAKAGSYALHLHRPWAVDEGDHRGLLTGGGVWTVS